MSLLEQENTELERRLRSREEEVVATRKALLDCQRLLHSSETDVDASIASKEELLKTFQTLQSKHQVLPSRGQGDIHEVQVRGEELARLREEVAALQGKLRLYSRGRCCI